AIKTITTLQQPNSTQTISNEDKVSANNTMEVNQATTDTITDTVTSLSQQTDLEDHRSNIPTVLPNVIDAIMTEIP
ncbi:1440_t:CDS:1, partial [Dentiscutata erythropus]